MKLKTMYMHSMNYTPISSNSMQISLKLKKNCIFSRRNGFRGLSIGKYNLSIRIFGIEIFTKSPKKHKQNGVS
jgi:hypothetical protein